MRLENFGKRESSLLRNSIQRGDVIISDGAHLQADQAALQRAAQRYLALANQFRSDQPTKADFNVFRGPEIFSSSPGLQELRNAVVLSGEWFVIAGGKAYCDTFVQTPSPPLSAYIVGRKCGITLLCERPVELPAHECFLLGGCPNYAHWVLDFLPRIAFYRLNYGPLLVNGPLLPFQIQALTHLGVSAENLVALDYPRTYLVRKLFYLSTGSAIAMPPLTFQPAIVDWLRDKFVKTPADSRRGRKLFISRAGHPEIHGRRLLNEAEIAAIASQQGFEIIRTEELSFETQVTLFSEASVIAGPHGAGCVNMVFAPRGARVIEMIGPRSHREQQPASRCYVNIATILGQNFVRIVGQSDENKPVFMDHSQYETYTIDPNKFRHAIRD
jgi:capsular polysaccharide biosynthesis protein